MSYFNDNEDYIIFQDGGAYHSPRYYENYHAPRTTIGSILYTVFCKDVIIMSGYAELKDFINNQNTPTIHMFEIIDDTPGKIMKVSFGGRNE